MPQDFEKTLDQYAALIVQIGLNLQAGQHLVVSAPIQAAPLVRAITAHAYQAGARLAHVFWGDEELTRLRFKHAPRDSFAEFPTWRVQAMEELLRSGAALVSIYAEDPDLLKGQDPELINTMMTTSFKHGKSLGELVSRNTTNWCVVSMPIPTWAGRIFPDLPPAEQEARLWEAIFDVCRLNQPDPITAWRSHMAELIARSAYLNNRQYAALKFSGPGTDLTVGLPQGHRWVSGQSTSTSGITYIPNMPTEEIFTLPHKDRVDGVVHSSKPLSYAGTLIEDFSLTFAAGRVTGVQAAQGESVLRDLIATDEGAARLGEVALVPHGSPISASGMLFFNTLFDENAASHLAVGRAYAATLQGGEEMEEEAFAAAGGNQSLVHVDFMIGSGDLDVDGLLADGTAEPVMRKGEWAFSV